MDSLFQYSEVMQFEHIQLRGWKDWGESFHDTYQLLPIQLGCGQQGVVKQCQLKATRCSDYAVKIMKTKATLDRVFSRREADIMSHLDHPCIVSHFGSFSQDRNMMVVMESLEGVDLLVKIARVNRIPEAKAIETFNRMVRSV